METYEKISDEEIEITRTSEVSKQFYLDIEADLVKNLADVRKQLDLFK